jgi:hypothetical protein
MSHRHVQGTYVGESTILPIVAYPQGSGTGYIMGSQNTVTKMIPPAGTYVYSVVTGAQASNSSLNNMDVYCTVYYKGVIIGSQVFYKVRGASILVTGILFSDGVGEFYVVISAVNSVSTANVVTFGVMAGNTSLVRITAR